MPALQPPSMQIAALPTGASSVSPLPPGPSLQYGFIEQGPSLIQQKVGNSSSAAPGSFTLSGITATQAGSFLVAVAAIAASGVPSTGTPAGGWSTVGGASGGNAGNTLACRTFIFPNNPGGITSVVLTTLTNVNGIAMWFGEFANVQALDTGYGAPGNNILSNSGTTPSTPAYNTPVAGPLLLVGLECDVTGQAYTPANVGANWVAGSTATSTGGATNCIVRPFWVVTNPELGIQYDLAGTLAGSIANGAALVSLLCSTSGPLLQPQPAGYQGGAPTVAGAWGALGNTKPGGAGSGQ